MIKAIETKYNGYRFRSRLEARWAVFFDACNEPWEYEVEGYDLCKNLGYYLPDFWLPHKKVFVEIKGTKPTKEEMDKVAALADQSGKAAILFVGMPDVDSIGQLFCWDISDGSAGGSQWGCYLVGDLSHRLYLALEPNEWLSRRAIYLDGKYDYQFPLHDARCSEYFLETQIEKAKAARFEHGENG